MIAEKKQGLQDAQLYWVRITLTSAAVRPLEKVAEDVRMRAKDMNLKLKGPIRLPTKVNMFSFFTIVDSSDYHPQNSVWWRF